MEKQLQIVNAFKKCIAITCFLFTAEYSFAGCDMCSLYLGLHPNQVKNGISIRYRNSIYNTSSSHVHNGVSHSTKAQQRTFQTVELWGQFSVGRKMQVLMMLPYAMNSVEENTLVLDAYNHLGDVQALARYQVFRSDEEQWLMQRVVLGLGVKAPTGIYKELSNEGYLDPHIQTGTGTWDVLYNIGYLAKYKNLSINEEVLYRMNTTNSLNFKFADRLSSNTNIYYTYTINDLAILPSIGYLLEYAGRDEENNIAIQNSNGTAHYLSTGLDVYFKNYSLNLNYQKPMVEHLRDSSTNNKRRIILGLGVNF